MSWDASPTWSGYIFQGEVALCIAIEIINNTTNIPDNYCLKIEEEEDFSIHKDNIQVYQVKAYTTHNYTKYAEAWTGMMKRYPENSENNFLILQKENCNKEHDSLINLIHNDKLNTNIITGVYTLNNISDKLNDEIKKLLIANNINFSDADLNIRRNYCCEKVYASIKRRHQTKKPESITLNDLKKWILENTAIILNEEIIWYEATKIFFDNLRLGLDDYDISIPKERSIAEKLDKTIFSLEKLSIQETRRLLSEHLLPHKDLDKRQLRSKAMDLIDSATIRSVIQKAIKAIKIDPIYKTLQYIKTKDKERVVYQLTANNEDFDLEDSSEKILFQKHCELIYNQPISKEVDYFVTKSLEKNQDEVKKHLINMTYAPSNYNPDNDQSVHLIQDKNFGFKTIDNTITDLNEE